MKKTLYKRIRGAIKEKNFELYNNISKRKSVKSVKKMVTTNAPKNILTKDQKAEIDEFFKEYSNLKINKKYHNFYTMKTNKFYVNYLPDDIYYRYVDGFFNDWNIANVIDNKCFYKRLLPNVKQADSIAYRVNNMWFDANFIPLSIANLHKLIRNEKEFFVKKAVESCGGHGVTYLKNDKQLLSNFNRCINDINGDIVIQKALHQSKTLAAINSSSVNTIRILSLLNRDGTVKIYSAILRMGIDGAKVDNASSGGITCGINEDGTLKNVAYKANGEKYFEHPTSGVHFETIKIPKFKEMKELVMKNHPLLPTSRLISWDLALNEENEIVLIEVNLKNGELDFHQLNNGPVFGNDTKKILDEVFGKEKNK